MADDQGSSKSWRGNTSKLDERSFIGIPICPVSAKEMMLQEKSEIRIRHESVSAASRILQEERSNASYTSGG
jgi:hypothetical protein